MVGRMIRNTMCEIGPNSSAAIISRAFSAHGDCLFGNGTDTQAPRSSVRSASPRTTSRARPHRFFHQERNVGLNQEARDLRHLGVPPQRDHEVPASSRRSFLDSR